MAGNEKNERQEGVNVKNNQKRGLGYMRRYVGHRLARTKFAGFLTILVLGCCILALGWLQWLVGENKIKVDELYKTVTVQGKIVKADSAAQVLDKAYIPRSIVVQLEDTGCIESFTLEAGEIVSTKEIIWKDDGERIVAKNDWIVRGIERPELSEDIQNAEIQYMDGYDDTIFGKTDYNDDNLVMVATASFLQMTGASVGEDLKIDFNGRTKSFKIVGMPQNIVSGQILMPTACLSRLTREENLMYSKVEFEIKPEKNYMLEAFKKTADELMEENSESFLLPSDMVVRDEELMNVVRPLEKNISMLEVLYPVLQAVAILASALMCLLFALRSAQETAVLRLLGTTRNAAAVMIVTERLLLSIIGIGAGVLATLLILRGDSLSVMSVVLNMVLCLAACLIASVAGALIVIRKKPMDLLSVKE